LKQSGENRRKKLQRLGCQVVYFQTKILILGKYWMESVGIFYILPFGLFYGHLVYIMVIFVVYMFGSFGVFFPVLVYFAKRNLAALFLISSVWPDVPRDEDDVRVAAELRLHGHARIRQPAVQKGPDQPVNLLFSIPRANPILRS
jgi:hypothetical protein